MLSFRKSGWALVLFLAARAGATDLACLQNGFSIRHEWREQIGAVTRLYLSVGNTSYVDVPTAQIDHFEKDLTPPAPAKEPAAPAPALPLAPASTVAPAVQLDQVIADVSGRHQIDPDLIHSVIHAESNFNSHAVSPKGAQGLMQLMPQTATKLGVNNAFDPAANVEGGTRYLRELLEKYNYDIVKALAAYNAGPLRVKQYGGVPPYYETRAYVARIVREFNRKKLAEQKAAAEASKSGSTPSSAAAVGPGSSPSRQQSSR